MADELNEPQNARPHIVEEAVRRTGDLDIGASAISAKPPRIEYKMSDAITHVNQTITIVTTLWAFYTVAAFTFAGFGLTTTFAWKENRWVAPALTVGYLAFSLGHLELLRGAIKNLHALKADVLNVLCAKENANFPYKRSAHRIAGSAESLFVSTFVHILGDISALTAMWSRVYQAGGVPWLQP